MAVRVGVGEDVDVGVGVVGEGVRVCKRDRRRGARTYICKQAHIPVVMSIGNGTAWCAAGGGSIGTSACIAVLLREYHCTVSK